MCSKINQNPMSKELENDFTVGPEIGRGRFGVVRRCTSLSTGEPFAVKSIDKSRLTDPLDRDCLHLEPKLHQIAAAANPHALQIHAVYEDASSLHLVLDLCTEPDLLHRIAAHSPLPEPHSAAIMTPLLESIAACHRHGVAHRDMKPDNVLFDSRGSLKLADFGSAAACGGGKLMSGLVGTPYYVAPEVVAGGEYGEKVDVWSAGVILYMMLSGAPPFYGETAAEIFAAVLGGSLRFPTATFRGVSPAAKDLIRRMLCRDVSRRLSAEQVLGHRWIISGGRTLKE